MEEEISKHNKKRKSSYFANFKRYVFQYRVVFGVVIAVLFASLFFSGLSPWKQTSTASVPQLTTVETKAFEEQTTRITTFDTETGNTKHGIITE
jgi:hypothetical protein